MAADDLPPVVPARGKFVRRIALVVAVVIVLVALAPGVTHRPDSVAALGPPGSDDAVRVRRAGMTLVYDKRRSYGVAKAAELFPNTVSRLAPADFVETDDGLCEVQHDVRFPWWR